MTDINKQIEEEAREFAFKNCPYHYSDCEIEHCNSNCQWHRYSNQDDSYKKFKQGAQFVVNASRWRKVSEELPEKRQQVIAKCECGNLEVSYYGEHSKRIMCDCEDCDNIVEWKPID